MMVLPYFNFLPAQRSFRTNYNYPCSQSSIAKLQRTDALPIGTVMSNFYYLHADFSKMKITQCLQTFGGDTNREKRLRL